MTHFFATPEQTRRWVDGEIERLRLLLHDELLPGGSHRCFLWPLDAPMPDQADRARGVLVHFPGIHEETLTMGTIGWKASAFPEPAATRGRRLSQQLARSLRKLATVPLHAVSYDGTIRSEKPAAWATPEIARAGMAMRQWRDGAVTFLP